MTRAIVLVIGSALLGAGLVAVALAERQDAPERSVVEIRGFAFQPQRVSVSVGDTIVWVNRDALPHTATSSTGGWDSGELPSGASWALVVEQPGTIEYLCTYHPTMRGTIAVTDGS